MASVWHTGRFQAVTRRNVWQENADKAPRILLHPCSRRRLFDLVLSDYFQGNDLLWQKLHGDQAKPDDWRW
jgi:hypothetical protein